MKFITLTTSPDSDFDEEEVQITVNSEQIVQMQDIEYSNWCTKLELSNQSALFVYETRQEILAMINEG